VDCCCCGKAAENSKRWKEISEVAFRTYIEQIHQLLDCIQSGQGAAISAAGAMVAETLQQSGIIHTFGTGHSHMIAEEAFFRAGGLVPVNAILDGRLSFLDGALESTRAEREEGYARSLIERERISAGDVAIIISNSGRNAAPIEMAFEMKERGVRTIAITNLRQSAAAVSRHSSGVRLFEVVDLAIDTCVAEGDAMLRLEAVEQLIGPASTVAGAVVINSIMIEAVSLLSRNGHSVPVFPSANAGASNDEDIASLYRPFRGRIRCLDKH
jgi:uncharacterized phosphosugar-binding protein